MEARIYARGFRHKNIQEVEVSRDGRGCIKILFDGKENKMLRGMLDQECELAPGMANCYHPKKGTMLAYYNILQHSYFEQLDEIKVEGDIGTMPYKRGVIY